MKKRAVALKKHMERDIECLKAGRQPRLEQTYSAIHDTLSDYNRVMRLAMLLADRSGAVTSRAARYLETVAPTFERLQYTVKMLLAIGLVSTVGAC